MELHQEACSEPPRAATPFVGYTLEERVRLGGAREVAAVLYKQGFNLDQLRYFNGRARRCKTSMLLLGTLAAGVVAALITTDAPRPSWLLILGVFVACWDLAIAAVACRGLVRYRSQAERLEDLTTTVPAPACLPGMNPTETLRFLQESKGEGVDQAKVAHAIWRADQDQQAADEARKRDRQAAFHRLCDDWNL